MHHTAAVGVRNGLADVDEARQQAQSIGQRRAVERVGERVAANAAHRVVDRAVRATSQLVDRDDAGMLQLARDSGLVDKSDLTPSRACAVGAQLLDRHVSANVSVQRAAHHPDAALPEQVEQPVALRMFGRQRAANRVVGGRVRGGRGRRWRRCIGRLVERRAAWCCAQIRLAQLVVWREILCG